MTTLCALLLLALAPAVQPPVVRNFTLANGETISTTIYEMADSAAANAPATIVIVPGMLGSAFGFRNIAPQLAERGHRIIIVDLLGSGSSSKPVKADYSLTTQSRRLEAVLDSLNVRNALFVPQAVSGSVTYRLAFHRPDMVRAIVGIDAGASEEAGTSGVRNAMKFAPLIRILGAKRILTGKIKDGLIDASYDPRWVTPEIIAEYAAPYRENSGQMLKVLQAIANAREPELIGPNLPKIQAPVVLLVGVAAKSLTPEKIAVLSSGLPNFTLQRVEKAGQMVNEEQPAVVIEAILRALGAP